MILTKVCWKQELWISESRKQPTLCEECKVSAVFYFLKIHNLQTERVRPSLLREMIESTKNIVV